MSFSSASPLPGFLAREHPFARRTFTLPSGQKMVFVDEGRGQPVLMVHGNPTWSYLWRKIIPGVVERGFRVIAPDLIGFGSSDKHRLPSDHSLDRHAAEVHALVDALALQDLIIVGQDWGGPIVSGAASRLAPGRVSAAVLANTAVLKPARPFRPTVFHRFAQLPLISDALFFAAAFPVPILSAVQGDKSSIGVKELAAYLHPFRWPWDRAGPLGLARMVPNRESHPTTPIMDAIGDWWSGFEGPIALVWGKRDPLLGRSLKRHRQAFPDAQVTETEAGHFLQEEVPELLVDAIGWARANTAA